MPVSLPSLGFSALDIMPDLGIAMARTVGGLIVTSRRSDPFFRGTITTGDLEIATHSYLQAFLIDCVDQNRLVDFVHPRHVVPRSYTLENLPWPGTGTITALPDNRTVTLSGLPIGLELKRGDRLTLEQGDLRCGRWIQSDVTVGSAIAEALPITPRLPIGIFAPGAFVQFKNPVMRFMVVPGSFSMAEAYRPTPISFDVSEAII